jgi:hypothetical protein
MVGTNETLDGIYLAGYIWPGSIRGLRGAVRGKRTKFFEGTQRRNKDENNFQNERVGFHELTGCIRGNKGEVVE